MGLHAILIPMRGNEVSDPVSRCELSHMILIPMRGNEPKTTGDAGATVKILIPMRGNEVP